MFEGPQTLNAGDSNFKSSHVGSKRIFRYLHCGDFRASPQHINHPSVRGKKLDIIYLDTTYLDPRVCLFAFVLVGRSRLLSTSTVCFPFTAGGYRCLRRSCEEARLWSSAETRWKQPFGHLVLLCGSESQDRAQ